MIGYFYFFAPDAEEVQETDQPALMSPDPSQTISAPQAAVDTVTLDDSAQMAMMQSQYGVFAAAASGEGKIVTYTSDVLQVDFSTLGGGIKKITLPGFETAFGGPLILRDAESTEENLWVNAGNLRVDLRELYYTTTSSGGTLNEGDTLEVRFDADLGAGRSVAHVYTLAYGSYVVGHRMEMRGLQNILGDEMEIDVFHKMKHQEEVVSTSRTKATVIYYTEDGSQDELTERSTSDQDEAVGEPLKWVNMKQKFFSTVYIADSAFASGNFATTVPNENDTTLVKAATLEMPVSLAGAHNAGLGFRYYFGPNDYNILRKVEPGLRGTIYLGWPPVKWVNRFLIIPIFEFFELFIPNYGLIIVLLVLVIKLMLSPLSYRSYKSMARMRVLKPETDAIKEKYPDDMQKQQQEQMALYRQVGVNPIAGCIPMVLQMPVLFAMFYFFPGSIELRQESLLWAHDLSTYDTLLSWKTPLPIWGATHLSVFTLLMTASTILYTWMNNQMSSIQGPMKNVTYFMPIIFLFVLNDFPAALTFYYFVSNLITFGQQALIRRFIDEDKIRAILDENKKNAGTRKKSKFQSRLEEAMKASEAAQKQRAAQKQKGGNGGPQKKGKKR